MSEVGASKEWPEYALEQALIIVKHLQDGGRNDAFLRPHALALLQIVDYAPLPEGSRRKRRASYLG